MVQPNIDLDLNRRLLQLETLYDLLVALHAHRSEQELVDDLLERVCSVVDPAAAACVTRLSDGTPRACASVGWSGKAPDAEAMLAEPLWQELLSQGDLVERRRGSFCERPFGSLLAAPFEYRGEFQGYLAILDKEERGGSPAPFSDEDRRFLQSVTALSAITLDGVRQVQSLVERSERLEEENKALKRSWTDEVDGRRIVAHSEAMRGVLERVERVAPRGVSVLVRGESGTGKELVAKLLHLRSARPGPLVAVNCAALPESLLESELFGIEGGVATGVTARPGKFELAHGGTLFLDEVGDIQVGLQAKLLRVLQEREIVRVGGRQTQKVDVRLITATHRDLEEGIVAGWFREDLYYRLKGVEVDLPPLRERREDIPHLVRHFIADFCQREGIARPRLRREALHLFLHHDYPGNVRELQNLVEGAGSLVEEEIDADLVRSLLGSGNDSGPEALDLAAVERRHIRRVLEMMRGNKSAAAKVLGLDRRTLQRKGF